METIRHYTLRELRSMIECGMAEDASGFTNEDRKNIITNEGGYTRIGYSSGVYGYNGVLFEGDKTGKKYAIVGRTSSLFVF